ncbi:MAG: ATP-binding protein [bacterium]
MTSKSFSKVIASNPEHLPEVEEFVLSIARDNGISEDRFNAIALSVSEAVSNSMVHGNKLNPDKNVYINVSVNDKSFTIKFRDEGTGFNLATVPDPTKPENILKDSGRGIHIIKSFVDDVRFNFTPTGTEIILIFNL